MQDDKKRIGALGLLIVFVLMMLFSAAFILTHTDHEHDHHGAGGSCAACAQLYLAQKLLENIAFVLLLAAALVAFLVFAALIQAFFRKTGNHTLVSLKVRLDN